MNLKALKSFCADDGAHRGVLRTIIFDGVHAYASNGKILARVESSEPESVGDDSVKMLGNMKTIFERAWQDTSEEWIAVQCPPPVETACKECSGTGLSSECPSCDGRGEITLDHDYKKGDKWESDKYDVECSLCGGTGTLGGSDGECDKCGGSGKYVVASHQDIFNARFDNKVLRIAESAGPFEIGNRSDKLQHSPYRLRGNGWQGVVTPMRKS